MLLTLIMHKNNIENNYQLILIDFKAHKTDFVHKITFKGCIYDFNIAEYTKNSGF